MEGEGSSPHIQQPAIRLHLASLQSNPHHHNYLSDIHFNIIVPSASRSPKWTFPLKFREYFFFRIYHLYACYTSCLSHSPDFTQNFIDVKFMILIFSKTLNKT